MQTPPTQTLATHEKRFQFVVTGGLMTLFAIVALAPHTERALFEDGRLPIAFAALAPAAPPAVGVLARFGYMAPRPFARAFRSDRRSPATPPVVADTAPDEPFFFTPDDVREPVLATDAGVLAPIGVTPDGGFQFASFTPGPVGFPGQPPVVTTEPTGDASPTPEPTPTATPTPTPTGTPTPVPTGTPTPVPTGTPTPVPTGTPTPVPTGTPTPVPTGTPTPVPTATPTPQPPVVTPPTPEPPVTPIPEPATWLMLVVGLGFIGTVLRRSRRGTRAAA